MEDLKDFILKKVLTLQPFRIPKGFVKCPSCEGSGEILVAYCDPGPNKYWPCTLCLSKGYEEPKVLEKLGWKEENGKWVKVSVGGINKQ